MEIFPASTPLGIPSSSNTMLCGNPALFLNTIFSPGLTEKLLGTKAKEPSSPPSNTSTAKALLAKIALAAVAATATPTSLSEDLMAHILGGVATLTTALLTLDAPADLRPVNDGIATAAGVTVAIVIGIVEMEIMCSSKQVALSVET